MSRKTRSDAILLNLPEERQEQLADWCEEPKTDDCPGGYKFAQEQLAADGIKVSVRCVSEFYNSYRLKQALTYADNNAQEAEEWFRSFNPEQAEKAREFGEHVFTSLAIRSQDPKTFAAMANVRDSRRSLELKAKFDQAKLEQKDRQIAQKDKDLALAERRVAVLEAKEAKAKETLSDSTLSAEDRVAKLRQTFGIA